MGPMAVQKTVIPVFLLTLAGSLVLLGGIFLGPLFKSQSWDGAAGLLYAVYSPLCHQLPERSFEFMGFPMTVCGRCLGIYAGFLAGTVLYPFLRGFTRLALPPTRFLILLSLPLAIDGLAGLSRLWTTPGPLRFLTGLIWGGLLPYYFIPGVSSALLERKIRFRVRNGGGLEMNPPKT